MKRRKPDQEMSNPVSLRLSNVTKHGQVTSSFPLITVTRLVDWWTEEVDQRKLREADNSRIISYLRCIIDFERVSTSLGLEEKKRSRRDRAIIENTVSFHFMRSDKVMTVMTLFSYVHIRFGWLRVYYVSSWKIKKIDGNGI